jgi:hypothetical protein
MFSERLKDLETHILNNKEVYYICGLVVVAGVSFYIGRRSGREITLIKNVISGQGNTLTNNWSSAMNRQGPPSYVVHQKGTENFWLSQSGCALSLGTDPTNISKHIRHGEPIPGMPNVIIERIGVVA